MSEPLNGAQSTVTVGVASALFLPANPKRVAVLVSSPVTNRITISNTNPAVLSNGITIPGGTVPVRLGRHEVGNWISQALFAICAVGPETIGVVEVMEP